MLFFYVFPVHAPLSISSVMITLISAIMVYNKEILVVTTDYVKATNTFSFIIQSIHWLDRSLIVNINVLMNSL